jgi:hypothetical protein
VVATWLSILNESEIPYARKTKESYPDLFSSHFVKKITVILAKRVPKTDITKMFECLIDEIFVMFGGCLVNRRSAFLWIQTAPLLADLCLQTLEHFGDISFRDPFC